MPEGMKLSNEQLSAVNLSINNPVSVITEVLVRGKALHYWNCECIRGFEEENSIMCTYGQGG